LQNRVSRKHFPKFPLTGLDTFVLESRLIV